MLFDGWVMFCSVRIQQLVFYFCVSLLSFIQFVGELKIVVLGVKGVLVYLVLKWFGCQVSGHVVVVFEWLVIRVCVCSSVFCACFLMSELIGLI